MIISNLSYEKTAATVVGGVTAAAAGSASGFSTGLIAAVFKTKSNNSAGISTAGVIVGPGIFGGGFFAYNASAGASSNNSTYGAAILGATVTGYSFGGASAAG
jgi:hypothetical protein